MSLLYSASRSTTEALITDNQQFVSGPIIGPPGQHYAGVMQRLYRVHKRGPVPFATQVFANFNGAIRTETDKVSVKGRMMQGAQ
jgi:hypothetical protein